MDVVYMKAVVIYEIFNIVYYYLIFVLFLTNHKKKKFTLNLSFYNKSTINWQIGSYASLI